MVRVLIYLQRRPVGPELADTAEVQAFMVDAAAVARGQAIFEGSCASFCHTVELEAELEPRLRFSSIANGITAPAIRIFSRPSPVA